MFYVNAIHKNECYIITLAELTPTPMEYYHDWFIAKKTENTRKKKTRESRDSMNTEVDRIEGKNISQRHSVSKTDTTDKGTRTKKIKRRRLQSI